ncbi:stalk domain-containing protein [Neomoorella thermoacetica]|uniref:stalk domain-containing protein n=1 Tax=Neomoorella thermoacetica TaxID=1525 RepID=UPI003BAF9077
MPITHAPLAVFSEFYLPVREVFTALGGKVSWDNVQVTTVAFEGRDIIIDPQISILHNDTLYNLASTLAGLVKYHLVLKSGNEIHFWR